MKRTASRTRRRDTGFSPPVRAIIHARSGGRCEYWCSDRAIEVQHRRARGAGGTTWPGINLPSNGLDLCRHHHAWAETRDLVAKQAGLWVSRYDNPALVPLVLPGMPPKWLTDDGDYQLTEPTDRTAE